MDPLFNPYYMPDMAPCLTQPQGQAAVYWGQLGDPGYWARVPGCSTLGGTPGSRAGCWHRGDFVYARILGGGTRGNPGH